MRLRLTSRACHTAFVCLHGSQAKALSSGTLRRAPATPAQLLTWLLRSSRQCHVRRALKQEQDQNDRQVCEACDAVNAFLAYADELSLLPQAAGDWAALAYTEEPEEIPAGLQEKLNRVGFGAG